MQQQRFLGIQQHGLTLLELVMAVLLLASCVIGIAAIYARHENVVRGGRIHKQAVELAQQVAKVIRQSSNPKDTFETTLGASCESKLTKLDAATHWVACWQDQVATELPNGSARISLDRNTVPAQYVIVVSWSEPLTGTASYVLRVVPGANQQAANSVKGS